VPFSAGSWGPRKLTPRAYPGRMVLEFSGEVWFWKGPAPWHFVTVSEDECAALESASGLVTYGWGMIPVTARIGKTSWKTSVTPKDGRYILPLKTAVRRAEGFDLGDVVKVRLTVDV
jgi:Domain of unknown function (DUF1905)